MSTSRQGTVASDPSPVLLSIEHLGVGFRRRDGVIVPAVRDLSIEVRAGRTTALVGESGSGKSVTATAIIGLLPRGAASIDPVSRILLRGEDLLRASPARLRDLRGAALAMVFQDPSTALDPVIPVGDQIVEALRVHRALSPAAARRRAVELLDEVGIPEASRRVGEYPHRLSGGQQQRVMIAMAIACEPALLIADEPTTALDVTVQRQILELLARLQQTHGMAMLFISHDLALTAGFAHEVAVMRDGALVEAGPVARVFRDPREPYTRALLACRPSIDGVLERLPVVEDFLENASLPIDPASPGKASAGEGRIAPHGENGSVVTSSGASSNLARASSSVSAPAASSASEHMASAAALLDVRHLRKEFRIGHGFFGHRTFVALEDVSFTLERGRTIGIVGESGSGKTTLGLTLLGLYRASAGQVYHRGRDLAQLQAAGGTQARRALQMVFQNPYASLNPRFSIARTLTEPLRLHGLVRDARDAMTRAAELLDRVRLPASALTRFPHEFSGGQRQRIAIARALALEPEIIICDEAVSALDASIQAQILNLLRDLQDETGIAYLFISHDLAATRHLAHEIVVLQAGRMVESGSAERIYDEPAHPYTRELLASVPRGIEGVERAQDDG